MGSFEGKKSDTQHKLEDIIPEVAFFKDKNWLENSGIHGSQL
jgi:hypothetical protein